MAIRAVQFRHALLRWYRKHGRDLPWRQTRNPYAVLVSEFMLQQTQVAAVLPFYNEWLRRFPDFAALARASQKDVLHAWQGLGYYARARHLHATAKLVQDRHRDGFPSEIDSMRELPGVGRYIAHATATFAFDQAVPVVEANTSRVLTRLFDLRLPIDHTAGRNALWQYARALLPPTGARIYNSALMDLGALVCLRRPKCAICAVKTFCRANRPETLPVKRARPPIAYLVENHALVSRRNKILLQEAQHRWRGMWILPRLALDGFKPPSLQPNEVYTGVFPFTHHRITLKVFVQRKRKIDSYLGRWFNLNALDTIPIPTPHRRAIISLLKPEGSHTLRLKEHSPAITEDSDEKHDRLRSRRGRAQRPSVLC
ncbi:MAG TPA: A/G-specific adenine glycosylase [Chthoniobacterales bacterium]|nr:A/G-specific adenine glycosylase [Chthoniobacterales bacterium]